MRRLLTYLWPAASAAVLVGIVTALTLELARSESPYGGSPELALGAFILTGLVPLAVMLTIAIARPLYLAERRRSGR